MHVTWKKHTLQFKRPGGTSRGVLNTKDSWFLMIHNPNWKYPAIGECSIIEGLSPDPLDTYERKLNEVCAAIESGDALPDLEAYPSIAFGVETLQADVTARGTKIFQDNPFTSGEDAMKINGLIWMGEIDFMRAQIEEKINAGFTCLKLKIGALDFEAELGVLRWIRSEFAAHDLELRVDANGAFHPKNALDKLNQLSVFDIHSIEQPIRAGQWNEMAELCKLSPIPIALDEELIGIQPDQIGALLWAVKPQYVILKPSLLGGIKRSEYWVQQAESLGIGWWLTSALESNVGLNAIAQYAYLKNVSLPQGLGTGGLYTNNFDSPLYIQRQLIRMQPQHNWNLNPIINE